MDKRTNKDCDFLSSCRSQKCSCLPCSWRWLYPRAALICSPSHSCQWKGRRRFLLEKKNMSDKKIGCPTYFLWHKKQLRLDLQFQTSLLIILSNMSCKDNWNVTVRRKRFKNIRLILNKILFSSLLFLNYNWTLDIQTKAVCLKFLFHLCTSDMKCSIKLNRVLSVCALSHKNHQRTIKSLEREERTPAILIRRVARWAQGERYFDLGRLSQLNY